MLAPRTGFRLISIEQSMFVLLQHKEVQTAGWPNSGCYSQIMEDSGYLTNKKMAPLWYCDLMTEWIVKSSRKEKHYHKYDGGCITGHFTRKFMTRDTIKSNKWSYQHVGLMAYKNLVMTWILVRVSISITWLREYDQILLWEPFWWTPICRDDVLGVAVNSTSLSEQTHTYITSLSSQILQYSNKN